MIMIQIGCDELGFFLSVLVAIVRILTPWSIQIVVSIIVVFLSLFRLRMSVLMFLFFLLVVIVVIFDVTPGGAQHK